MRKSENILSEKQLPAITKRIKQLVEHYAGGSVKLFSEQISLASSQKLNRIFNIDKRNNEYPEVSSDILIAIANMYSLVDVNWILTGRGSMLRTDSVQHPVEPTSVSAPSDTVVLRLMDKLDAQESKIDQLQSELRTMEKELAVFKAKYPHESPPGIVRENGEVLGSSETAKDAHSKRRTPASEPSYKHL